MTKADIVNDAAKTTGIDKSAVIILAHNIPTFKSASSFKDEVAK